MAEMLGRPEFRPGRKIDGHHAANVSYRKVRSADKLIVSQARFKPSKEMLKPKTPSLCERRNLFEGRRLLARMQKKYGFAPLGDANSAVKQLIFAGNATRFYKIKLKAADNTRMPAFSEDRLAALKNEYALAAKEPSNLRYGYVRAA
jgi:hypothetical protein